jgi:hypothetical protein
MKNLISKLLHERLTLAELKPSVGTNTKTGKSIDIDTECPKKEFSEFHCMSDDKKARYLKDLESKSPGASQQFLTDFAKARKAKNWEQCSYCYVKGAREKYQNAKGFSLAKPVYSDSDYNGEILHFHQGTIDNLNSIGGIRLFSHSDYKPRHKEKLKRILDDCAKVGLKVKAITKQVQFVADFINHPAINLIHLSIDNVGSGVNQDVAKKLKAKFPNKIRIRAVIVKIEDLLEPIMNDVDIFTFYHGASKLLKAQGYQNFSGTDRFNIKHGAFDPKSKGVDPKTSKQILNKMKELEAKSFRLSV